VIAPLLALTLLADPEPAPRLDLTAPTTFRVYGQLRTRAAIDLVFDSLPDAPLAENVAEARTRGVLGAEATYAERAKIVAEVRLRHRAVEQRPPAGERFLLLNGARAKATLEVNPGEAYVDLYTGPVDLRLGNQILSFGASAAGAPADVLNPLDLREGVLFADPADLRLPVLAARARGEVKGFAWTVAYVPFFVPDRYDLVGQDEALVQPGLGVKAQGLSLLNRAQEDRAQQPLLETDRPKDLPQEGDLGLRVTHKLGPATVGADYVITREKLPEVQIDPELARFLSEGPKANFTDPATSLSLSQRLASGERLLRGQFPRYAVGELEGSALLGPVQVDADLGYSASRLYVDQHSNPVFHPTATATVTVADARGTDLVLAVSALALWVRDIPQGERLLLVDLPGAESSAHQTLGAGAAVLAGYRFLQGRLETEGRLFLDVRQGSHAEGVRATWNLSDRVHLASGVELFFGPVLSPFGYFRRNSNGYAELRLDL
jgi:hypothetical protein